MSGDGAKIYEFGEFRVDARKRLLIKGGGSIVTLTPKVFDLLLYLVQNSEKVIEKDELLAAIWADTIVEESNLSQNISILRRVLGEKRAENRYIATIPGHGYKFVAPVRESEELGEAESETERMEKPAANRRSAPDKFPPKRFARGLIIFAVFGFAATAFYFWRAAPPPRARGKTIAVLPFKPLVVERRDEALEMGMADTLIARLGGNREIVVRPLGSVRKFVNLEQDPQSAGRELDVDSVLEGSIQRAEDKIRVNVRLVSTADGAALWSGTFDEKFTDIFNVQDAISNKVAEALKIRFADAAAPAHQTKNVEAYRLYLQGRYQASKLTLPEIRRSIEFYQQAIDLDPLYALAYAGMAESYRTLPITSDIPAGDAFPQSKKAAERALEIDDRLVEARIILGWLKAWFEWDWTNAEAELKKVIEINPNKADARRAYSLVLTSLGRHDEAVAEMKLARELDPLSLIINALEGQALHYAGRDAEAVARLNKTLEMNPNFWIANLQLGRIYSDQKRYEEASEALRKAMNNYGVNTEAISLLGYTAAKAGRAADAQTTLAELKSAARERYVPPYNVAMICNGLGKKDEALQWLEKALQERDVRLILIKVEPKWNNLRNEPRFRDLLRRMNFE